MSDPAFVTLYSPHSATKFLLNQYAAGFNERGLEKIFRLFHPSGMVRFGELDYHSPYNVLYIHQFLFLPNQALGYETRLTFLNPGTRSKEFFSGEKIVQNGKGSLVRTWRSPNNIRTKVEYFGYTVTITKTVRVAADSQKIDQWFIENLTLDAVPW